MNAKKLLLIGAGPGGYPAAFHAADLGLDVTLVDMAAIPGGVCLYRGLQGAESPKPKPPPGTQFTSREGRPLLGRLHCAVADYRQQNVEVMAGGPGL